MDWKVVYEMRPEYKRYLYNRFKPNLKSLRVKIIDDNHYAEFDDEALKHDRLIYPIEEYNSVTGKCRWDGSKAQKSLKKDVADGIEKQKSSRRALWISRPEYQLFDVDVFRKHVVLSRIEIAIRRTRKREKRSGRVAISTVSRMKRN
jgi:hypothetical protein